MTQLAIKRPDSQVMRDAVFRLEAWNAARPQVELEYMFLLV